MLGPPRSAGPMGAPLPARAPARPVLPRRSAAGPPIPGRVQARLPRPAVPPSQARAARPRSRGRRRGAGRSSPPRRSGPAGAWSPSTLRRVEPIPGVDVIRARVGEPGLVARLGPLPFDVVLSDLSPRISGAYATDHARSADLVREAWALSRQVLVPGGKFVAKVFDGDLVPEVLEEIGRSLRKGAAYEAARVARSVLGNLHHRDRVPPQPDRRGRPRTGGPGFRYIGSRITPRSPV